MMMEKYVGFLRGINLGRHHKVPMQDLRTEFQNLGFKNVLTILNSGNILFESDRVNLESEVEVHLDDVFGFPVPTLIRDFETIARIYNKNPFEGIEITKDIRFYVSFLRNEVNDAIPLPWNSQDHSFQIMERRGKNIFSVLDLSISSTPDAMAALEKFYGKEITTRNWKTIQRIMKKAETQKWL